MKTWSTPTTWDEVCRRAAGRNRYNLERQWDVKLRRLRILETLVKLRIGFWQRGAQAEMARRLKVSPATISRDWVAIIDTLREATYCPVCNTLLAAGHGWLPAREAEAG